MLKQAKAFIRKTLVSLMGEKVFIYYSLFWALLAGWFYGNPSKKMLVVVVTGTKGKTSTLNFLWHVLTAGGYKVGLISTANIRIGSVEKMNWYHMTMPGRFLLQKLLRQMSDARCDIALVEATSEGIKMGRHIGLYYDVAVFTNLHPEHLKSHGNSFEEYRRMKGKLFQNLSTLPLKRWNGLDLEKVSIVNADSKDSEYFLQFDADKKYSYGENNGEYRFANVLQNQGGVSFSALGSGEDVEDVFEESFYEIPILGFVIIVSKRHIYGIDEFTEEEGRDFIHFASKLRRGMRSALGIEHVYLVQEEDTANSHFHLWIFPRYKWMEEKFGRKVQSLKPIMEYAREHMKTENYIKKVDESTEKLRQFFSAN